MDTISVYIFIILYSGVYSRGSVTSRQMSLRRVSVSTNVSEACYRSAWYTTLRRPARDWRSEPFGVGAENPPSRHFRFKLTLTSTSLESLLHNSPNTSSSARMPRPLLLQVWCCHHLCLQVLPSVGVKIGRKWRRISVIVFCQPVSDTFECLWAPLNIIRVYVARSRIGFRAGVSLLFDFERGCFIVTNIFI